MKRKWEDVNDSNNHRDLINDGRDVKDISSTIRNEHDNDLGRRDGR